MRAWKRAARRFCLGVALTLTTSASQADTLKLPSDYLSGDQRAAFRLCRAAILVENDADESKRTMLPPAAIAAMREQVAFIMAETIFNVPALSYEDGAKRLEFTETFVFEFGKTVRSEMSRLDDPAERLPILLSCQSLLWVVVKERIDILIRWRVRALGLDRAFPTDHQAAGSVPVE